MIAQALKWVGGVDGFLELIDQRRLPGELVRLQCRDIEAVYEAIKTLAVRGAPAIGVAAAYGLVLGLQKCSEGRGMRDEGRAERGLECVRKSCEYLASSRPTAVNLFWAMDRVRQKAEQFVAAGSGVNLSAPAASALRSPLSRSGKQSEGASKTAGGLQEVVLSEANAIYTEDVDMCRRIGENGEKFINDEAGILTHCNAGALATAGQGTALSVMFEAHKKGRKFKVYADETRPLLQGARLTAWELKQAGINVVVVCDNVAGWLMKQGEISAVITGADRIAANGDAANKIGTYSLSILARAHGIPFYIAAPSSTFDLSIKSGVQIPIEQRSADEVRFFGDRKIVPEAVDIYNPAFDVTEAQDITAIITERGVVEKPCAEKIARHLG